MQELETVRNWHNGVMKDCCTVSVLLGGGGNFYNEMDVSQKPGEAVDLTALWSSKRRNKSTIQALRDSIIFQFGNSECNEMKYTN